MLLPWRPLSRHTPEVAGRNKCGPNAALMRPQAAGWQPRGRPMLWAAWSTTWRREKTPQESRPARVCATLLCGTGGIYSPRRPPRAPRARWPSSLRPAAEAAAGAEGAAAEAEAAEAEAARRRRWCCVLTSRALRCAACDAMRLRCNPTRPSLQPYARPPATPCAPGAGAAGGGDPRRARCRAQGCGRAACGGGAAARATAGGGGLR